MFYRFDISSIGRILWSIPITWSDTTIATSKMKTKWILFDICTHSCFTIRNQYLMNGLKCVQNDVRYLCQNDILCNVPQFTSNWDYPINIFTCDEVFIENLEIRWGKIRKRTTILHMFFCIECIAPYRVSRHS
jgi:hypothetical protein